MRWKNLKNFAIVLILIVDLVFAFFIVRRRNAVLYYDASLIDSAIRIFEADGIYVERTWLEARKEMPAVYTGTVSKNLFTNLKNEMVYAGYLTSKDAGGLYFSGKKGDFFFGNDFVFSYEAKNIDAIPSELLVTENYALFSDEAQKEEAFRLGMDFLNRYMFSYFDAEKFQYSLSFAKLYRGESGLILHLLQSIDGIPFEEGLYFLIVNGEVVAADGIFAVLFPEEKKMGENVGLMNIFFAEKAYWDAIGKDPDGAHIVSDISYSYGLYFDAESTYYLIPLCKITYQSGETRTYNFISGTLYS